MLLLKTAKNISKDKPTISIVTPTFNEDKNMSELSKQLLNASKDHGLEYNYEWIVVDDGYDKTGPFAEMFGAKVIKGKRQGLGQAIIDGINAAQNNIVVVMDADLSHDPRYIPELVSRIECLGFDMAIGSRYVEGGGCIGWSLKRRIISRVACLLSRPIIGIKDSTSGYFAIRKNMLDWINIKPDSWKIMLEIAVKTNAIYYEEPIIFTDRVNGESKFNKKEIKKYLRHLWRLFVWKHANKKM